MMGLLLRAPARDPQRGRATATVPPLHRLTPTTVSATIGGGLVGGVLGGLLGRGRTAPPRTRRWAKLGAQHVPDLTESPRRTGKP